MEGRRFAMVVGRAAHCAAQGLPEFPLFDSPCLMGILHYLEGQRVVRPLKVLRIDWAAGRLPPVGRERQQLQLRGAPVVGPVVAENGLAH